MTIDSNHDFGRYHLRHASGNGSLRAADTTDVLAEAVAECGRRNAQAGTRKPGSGRRQWAGWSVWDSQTHGVWRMKAQPADSGQEIGYGIPSGE